jgi:hypothetical protein
MINGLDWTDLPRPTAREILAQLLDITDKRRLLLKVSGKISPLPFYKEWRLVWLSVDNPKGEEDRVLEDVWALWNLGEAPLLLDGSSGPVHETNARENLQLDEPLIADYIRWFCFAVTADDQPFLLFEKPPKIVTPKDKKALALAKPLTPVGRGDDGTWKYEATVVFTGAAFKAVFAVQANGEMEMLDDEPLMAHVPERLLPAAPTLGIGQRLNAYLAELLGSAPQVTAVTKQIGGSRRRHARTSRPTIVELVELLLVGALRAQAANRLLTYFNAALPAATELQRFAALFEGASPVVVVETNIPFVEETISEIVNDLRAPQQTP